MGYAKVGLGRERPKSLWLTQGLGRELEGRSKRKQREPKARHPMGWVASENRCMGAGPENIQE